MLGLGRCGERSRMLLFLVAYSPSVGLGYRQVRRRLNKLGYRVQWNRIIEAMHRIDGIGILQRMNKLGIVMSGTDKVPSPLSLVYIETNYKLVRWVNTLSQTQYAILIMNS